jgi:hypothetical protein
VPSGDARRHLLPAGLSASVGDQKAETETGLPVTGRIGSAAERACAFDTGHFRVRQGPAQLRREFLSIPGPTVVPGAVLAAMQKPAVDIYAGPLVARSRMGCSPT